LLQINDGVVFIRGAKNGAIYDFNTGKVFSVNSGACELIEKLTLHHNSGLSAEETAYISLLAANNLYDVGYTPVEYTPQPCADTVLSLVWLEITQRCNQQCLHCYEGDNHHSSTETISLLEWERIIDYLKNVERIVVIGGEPCLHKDIKAILLHLAKNRINTTLFTNGTAFTGELLDIIAENSIKVKTSLYGHRADIHDRITKVSGSFDTLISAIKTLVSRGVQVDIAVVAMKENQDYLEDIRKLIVDLGVKYHKHDIIRAVFGGTQNAHAPDKPEVLKQAQFSEPSFYCSKERFDRNVSHNSCWYGKIAITETGDVLPCVFERNIKYGNVLRDTLGEVLNSAALRENWFRCFDSIEVCKNCEFRFACKDCRPLGISRSGDINGKNPRCLYDPATGIWGDVR
jgi:radical SAM protein with 4Fe4S-binding SPASM domain